MTVRDGKRTGTYQAFAEPFVGRGLTVLTFAHVTKVGREKKHISNMRNFLAQPGFKLKTFTVGQIMLLLISFLVTWRIKSVRKDSKLESVSRDPKLY